MLLRMEAAEDAMTKVCPCVTLYGQYCDKPQAGHLNIECFAIRQWHQWIESINYPRTE